MTLEGITGDSSADNYEIDGHDVVHSCKNQVCFDDCSFDAILLVGIAKADLMQKQVGRWLLDHRPLDEWARGFEV